MARYFLEVMYVGTAFHGSQLQGETATVQLAINKALSLLLRCSTLSFGSSRTDEGVHALGNYYHFDTDAVLDQGFVYKMNAILPSTISVKNMYRSADAEFNARFGALSRCYRYRIYAQKNPFLYQRALYYPFRLDRDVLNETAKAIMEYRNFESFSKRNTQSKTFICQIIQSYWKQDGAELHYVVEANRFLRGMVRGLVGTQLKIARGKGDLAAFRDIVEGQDCTLADFSVAGHGLYLEEVKYPVGALLPINERT